MAQAALANGEREALHKLRFLVATNSWEMVKKVFKDDLNVAKDKKDDSVIPIRDHFVVEIEFTASDLTDDFYKKVFTSKYVTIISDSYSQAGAREVLDATATVELKLRELAVYAYDLAVTYKKIMNTKHKDAKSLISNNHLVGSGVADPVVSFLDFGELIDFLGKTGNLVDDSNLADDTARLMEESQSFDDFKKKYSERFKKLTVWEIISRAVLLTNESWGAIKRDLGTLKDIRNTALHHRVLTPSKVVKATAITEKMLINFKTKPSVKKSVENLDEVFDSWNNALIGYNSAQRTLSSLFTPDTGALQRIFDTQVGASKTLQDTLATIGKFPKPQTTSAMEALARSMSTINRMGLSSWSADSEQNDESTDSSEEDTKGDVSEEDEEDIR